MMNLKILRLTGVASALSAISLTQAAEEASPKTDGKNEPNTYQEKFMKRAIGISRPKKMYYAAARDRTDIAKSRHIGWVAIHDMKFTISILYLPVTQIL